MLAFAPSRALGVAVTALTLVGCAGIGPDRQAPPPLPPPAKLDSTLRGAQPREPLSRAVDRFERVIDAGDCAGLRALFHPDVTAPAPQTCAGTIRGFERAKVSSTERFGSAAIVRFKLPRGGVVELVEALDREGRFRLVFFAGKASEGQAPSADADRYAAAALRALRAGRCREFADLFARYAPGASTRTEICALRHVQRARAALRAGGRQRLNRLGGDGSVAFYALRLERRGAFTVVLIADEAGDYRYGFGLQAG